MFPHGVHNNNNNDNKDQKTGVLWELSGFCVGNTLIPLFKSHSAVGQLKTTETTEYISAMPRKKLQTIYDSFGICCQQELKEERSAPCVKWRQTSRSASETLAVHDGPTFAFWIESCERRVSSASSAGQKHKASLFPHINTSFCEANSAPVKRS